MQHTNTARDTTEKWQYQKIMEMVTKSSHEKYAKTPEEKARYNRAKRNHRRFLITRGLDPRKNMNL